MTLSSSQDCNVHHSQKMNWNLLPIHFFTLSSFAGLFFLKKSPYHWRRNLSTGRYRTPNTTAEGLTIVNGTRVHVRTMRKQVVRIVAIERSRRPIVAAATSIARRRCSEVAGVEEVIWECAPT